MKDHIPLLNVGFSNRRRFLARDNQSDKTGYDGGDKWLYFSKDTFDQALAVTPEKHWFLQRLNPPRLGMNTEGYYYDFKDEIICDDPGHIVQKAKEQKALLSVQRFVRGSLARARVARETAACLIIQKYLRGFSIAGFRRVHGTISVYTSVGPASRQRDARAFSVSSIRPRFPAKVKVKADTNQRA